ncbi:MAG: hypothetical protein NVS3B12_15310 [Acidimicrobiales bacterium]
MLVFEKADVDDPPDAIHVDTGQVLMLEELDHLSGYAEAHRYILRRRRYRVTSGIDRTPTTTPATTTAPAATVATSPTTAITSPLS